MPRVPRRLRIAQGDRSPSAKEQQAAAEARARESAKLTAWTAASTGAAAAPADPPVSKEQQEAAAWADERTRVNHAIKSSRKVVYYQGDVVDLRIVHVHDDLSAMSIVRGQPGSMFLGGTFRDIPAGEIRPIWPQIMREVGLPRHRYFTA